jgi:hypothetical protein
MRKCGSCGSNELNALFSLGKIPPVNAFLERQEIASEVAYPLDLYVCTKCLLAQIGDCVPPERLFTNYLHLSSASGSNINHLKSVSELIAKSDAALATKKILEIGSNDGTLLSFLKPKAKVVLGVDPAKNLAIEAKKRGVETISDFFNQEKATEILKEKGKFDWVVALNVVPHTPQFTSLLKGVHALMDKGGRFFLEGAYVVDTILNGQFDTIYHEHVYNFSFHSLNFALNANGFTALDVEIIPTQGTSVRVYCARSDDAAHVRPSVAALLKSEKEKGYCDIAAYELAGDKVRQFAKDFKAKIAELKKTTGKKLIGLGAPARGVVILNYCKVGVTDIEFIIDDTVLKQGRYTPGVHIPVVGWDKIDSNDEHTYLLLSWNYKNEILKKLKERGAKGRLLVPFPKIEEVVIG